MLEIGTASGGFGAVLAHNSREVVGIDFSKKMVSLAKEKVNADNFNVVQADGHSLPFKDGSVEAALILGVFEWIPASSPNKNPKLTHLETLQGINRVVKENGVFVIGIENRYWLQYWLGFKDFHSGLRFVTVLPRKIADFVANVAQNHAYLERLYGYDELNEIIVNSGFRVIGRYTALPGWFSWQKLSDLSEPEQTGKEIDATKWGRFDLQIPYNMNMMPKVFWKIINNLGLLKLFCSNFVFVCEKATR